MGRKVVKRARVEIEPLRVNRQVSWLRLTWSSQCLRVPVSLAVVFLLVSRCCCCCCCSYRCFLIVGVLLSFLSQEVALPKNADGGKFNHYFSIVNMKNHLTRYSRFDNECSPKFEQNLLTKNINKTESICQNKLFHVVENLVLSGV